MLQTNSFGKSLKLHENFIIEKRNSSYFNKKLMKAFAPNSPSASMLRDEKTFSKH